MASLNGVRPLLFGLKVCGPLPLLRDLSESAPNSPIVVGTTIARAMILYGHVSMSSLQKK